MARRERIEIQSLLPRSADLPLEHPVPSHLRHPLRQTLWRILSNPKSGGGEDLSVARFRSGVRGRA